MQVDFNSSGWFAKVLGCSSGVNPVAMGGLLDGCSLGVNPVAMEGFLDAVVCRAVFNFCVNTHADA